MLPAKVMVAPNSPSARAQASTAPAATDGAMSGSVTRRNTVNRPAPRLAAASSKRWSMLRSAPSTVMTKKGMATNVSAMIAPAVENVSWMPKASCSHPPIGLRRLNAASRATPPTTGGSTIGSRTRPRTSGRPGTWVRASTQASGVPKQDRQRRGRQRADQREPQTRRSACVGGEVVPDGRPVGPLQDPDEREREERDGDGGGDHHERAGGRRRTRLTSAAGTRTPSAPPGPRRPAT